MNLERIIISGGGTGGHIFPAIAIAKAIQHRFPSCNILFIGANGRMEMEKVPQAGFEIKGLTISGFNRKSPLKNLTLPIKLWKSMSGVRSILSQFKPQLVIGVGGYASGPTLKMAQWMNLPTLIQEQNSFPGKTNLLLAKKAKAICVAYEGMEQFFPKSNLIKTGNPVRQELVEVQHQRAEALAFYGLNASCKTVFVMGGSLGAKTMNQAILNALQEIETMEKVQVLWQCGKAHFEELNNRTLPENVHLFPFIERMEFAYAAADIIISRAGATSISELALVAKPIILVPSPNVSEDHQTKNALALSNQGAAWLVPDAEAPTGLWPNILRLLEDTATAERMSLALHSFALPNATNHIVDICQKMVSNE